MHSEQAETDHPYPRFTIKDLCDLPVKKLDAAYWGAWNGQKRYNWWHRDDFLLVEELNNALRRNMRDPMEECSAPVSKVLSEDQIKEACEVAKFRSELAKRRQHRDAPLAPNGQAPAGAHPAGSIAPGMGYHGA